MRSKPYSPRARMPGLPALVLGTLGLGMPAALAHAAELPATASARIEQLAGVTLAEKAPELHAEAGLGRAAFDAPGAAAGAELTVTAPPHTAVSLTILAAPASGQDPAAGTSQVAHDAGPQPATDAEGRLVVRLGTAAAVIVNY